MHNHAVEAQLQSVRTELEGIRACGQPHLIGALSGVLHVKGDGRASGVDEGGREVTGILWGGHRVLHRQPLDVAFCVPYALQTKQVEIYLAGYIVIALLVAYFLTAILRAARHVPG